MNPPFTERAYSGLHEFVFAWMESNHLFKDQPSLLDIGCGSGAFLNRCQSKGLLKLRGLDLEISQFRLKNIPVNALNIDEYVDDQWGEFDLITAMELIEHLQNPGKLFQLIDNNLSKNGTVILSTPNIHSIAARLSFLIKGRLPHFDHKSDPTHIYPVYVENLERVLKSHALRIDGIFSFPKKGHRIYSKAVTSGSNLLRTFIKEPYPGDNLIFKIVRA